MRRILLLLGTIALLLAACNDGSGADGATGPTDGTSPATVTGPTATTAATGPTAVSSPTLAPELEEGEHFGFVESVDAVAGTMVFDLAYFLTGDEATEAARERGDEAPPPNDYYIVNDNPRLRTLALAPDIELALLDWNDCCDEFFRGDLTTFAATIDADEPIEVGDHLYYGSLSPYWLTVEGGVIVRIQEQYLP